MAENGATRVLIVDDNRLDRDLMHAHLMGEEYQTEFATNGAEAWGMLDRDPDRFDVVLLDRSMPQMTGLEVLARVKEDARLSTLPVIMQTAFGSKKEMLDGLRAGAYYYLTKPYDGEMLRSVVRTAARDRDNYKALQRKVQKGLGCLKLMSEAVFTIQTIDQARDLGSVLANTCPDPMSIVIGLTELLVNAVEHGNLGITYDEKTALNKSGAWSEEVRRRLALPENAHKMVEVRFERNGGETRFTIRDEGKGFEWQRFLEIDASRAFDTHGRGIVMARRLSFDNLEYRGCGNEVVGTVRSAAPSPTQNQSILRAAE